MKTVFQTAKLVSTALLLLIVLVPPVTTATQEPAKTLEWGEHANFRCAKIGVTDSGTPYEVELEDILIDGRSVLIGEAFVGDIRDLVFVVKNISARPLGFIQVTVILPEVKIPPQIPFIRAPSESKTTTVPPGGQADLRVPRGKLYDWVKETVASQGMELQSIKGAAIDGVTVEKGAQPVGVCMTTRDPRNARVLRN